MSEQALKAISDRITDAHTRIQQDFDFINPVVGVNRQMRTAGIPADAMTVDCLKTNRRILLILHDQQPEQVHYQFGQRDQDPGPEFKTLSLDEVSEQQLYDWMASYFSVQS